LTNEMNPLERMAKDGLGWNRIATYLPETGQKTTSK